MYSILTPQMYFLFLALDEYGNMFARKERERERESRGKGSKFQ